MEKQNRLFLLYQNYPCHLGKGFWFNSFYIESYRFSCLKTFLNESKLVSLILFTKFLFTKLEKVVGLPSLCYSQSQWKKQMTNTWNTQLEWVGNDIFPRLSIVYGYPLLMPCLVLMLFCLANDYLEHAASRTPSRTSLTTRYLTVLAHFFNSITSQVFCKNIPLRSCKKKPIWNVP